jgi:hypothetical protein
MKTLKLSRRRMMAMAGATAVLAPSVVASAGTRARGQRARASGAHEDRPRGEARWAAELVAPLGAGSTLGSWRVQGVGALRAGAVSITLLDAAGGRFYLDVCKRDGRSGAPVPPGRSELCDVFVANEGNGSVPTHEDHGLAAMALADIVRTNERRVGIEGLLTQRDRMRSFPDQVMRGA